MGFSSGTENPHGVKAVTRGQRCAIALWFTLDARHSERVRAADTAVTWKGPCSASVSPSPLTNGSDTKGALGLGVRETSHSSTVTVITLPCPPWPFFPTYNGAPGGQAKMGNDPGSWFLIGHYLSCLCPERGTYWEGDELRGH